MSRGRRAYNRILADDNGVNTVGSTDSRDIENQESPTNNDNKSDQELLAGKDDNDDDDDVDDEDDGNKITVVVMDPAQNKFQVQVNTRWTVARFKKEGVTVHKIAVSQQRLIFMGRLLADDTILEDVKINADGVIVHLFPKPRVVVQSASNSMPQTDQTTGNAPGGSGNDNGSEAGGGGAHVPQIVLDPDEAQMRSQILVLGSAEILDAQNNVKLLSFLLLIITTMELLALFTIMLEMPQGGRGGGGVPDRTDDEPSNGTDDMMPHNHSTDQNEVRTWRNSDYFDLALNLFGFYSAMLGIKATTENTRRLAKRYLICTILCGIFWNAFYYYLNYQLEQEIDAEVHKEDPSLPILTQQDFLMQAFFAILIPMMIWFMCCMRAYQFHSLLEEAEMEAEQRIQNELTMDEENGEEEDGIMA